MIALLCDTVEARSQPPEVLPAPPSTLLRVLPAHFRELQTHGVLKNIAFVDRLIDRTDQDVFEFDFVIPDALALTVGPHELDTGFEVRPMHSFASEPVTPISLVIEMLRKSRVQPYDHPLWRTWRSWVASRPTVQKCIQSSLSVPHQSIHP
jgi:hypothetical protein